jgi:hypothetical protein
VVNTRKRRFLHKRGRTIVSGRNFSLFLLAMKVVGDLRSSSDHLQSTIYQSQRKQPRQQSRLSTTDHNPSNFPTLNWRRSRPLQCFSQLASSSCRPSPVHNQLLSFNSHYHDDSKTKHNESFPWSGLSGTIDRRLDITNNDAFC